MGSATRLLRSMTTIFGRSFRTNWRGLGEEGEEIAMQGKKRVGRGERNQPPAYELRDVSLIRGRRSTFALPKAAIGY